VPSPYLRKDERQHERAQYLAETVVNTNLSIKMLLPTLVSGLPPFLLTLTIVESSSIWAKGT
jgi:hypothetical protein